MNNLWEYEPKNLLVAKIMHGYPLDAHPLGGGKPFPRNGQLIADCILDTTKHKFKISCSCGLYGFLSVRSGKKSWFIWQSFILAEVRGQVAIGENGVIRAEELQVIATIKERAYEFTSEYFNVPIIKPDQAQNMINKQMEVWNVELPIGV